jgi:hexosaminidase
VSEPPGGPLLLPAPREIEHTGAGLRIEQGRAPEPGCRRDRSLPAQGFALEIAADGVRIRAADDAGERYARGALAQIVAQCAPELPGLRIRDWPDFAQRGYMLDVSRDRVPTRETLGRIVGLLDTLRLNQLQLYTEHTFAYRDHETVWRDASPLTAEDVRWLDGECAARGIELVPNQNAFGHMERWLAHEPYRALAECPEGTARRDHTRRPPACLAPTDESLAFARGLFRELLPCFRSRTVNVNCDETFELGRGRSGSECRRHGTARVYLDWVLRLVDGLRSDGYAVQMWGDVVASAPELVPELRREGLTPLVWGYEAPRDPDGVPPAMREAISALGVDPESLRGFSVRVRPFADADLPFWVCPGTSSWNSLVGRLPNALGNLRDAAEAGLASGARGYLITDWGDNGHLQPWPVSLAPLAYGAAVSWCVGSNARLPLERTLGRVVLRDPSGELARALSLLGSAYTESGLDALNASPLFLALLAPPGAPLRVWGETNRERLAWVHGALDDGLARLARARPELDDAALIARELAASARLARHGAWRLARELLGTGPAPAVAAADLEQAIEEQRAVWLERSRPGGLDDSVARLRARLAEYSA